MLDLRLLSKMRYSIRIPVIRLPLGSDVHLWIGDASDSSTVELPVDAIRRFHKLNQTHVLCIPVVTGAIVFLHIPRPSRSHKLELQAVSKTPCKNCYVFHCLENRYPGPDRWGTCWNIGSVLIYDRISKLNAYLGYDNRSVILQIVFRREPPTRDMRVPS